MCKNSDDLKINQNSTANTPLIPKRENMTRISFLEFSKQLSIIVFPGMLFYICVMLVGTINLVYISQTYKDEDMIKAIGICHLYFNSTVACIVQGLISSIDSLGSNAYAAKKYSRLPIRHCIR
jgi:Na+-driven multidrug efflux pump